MKKLKKQTIVCPYCNKYIRNERDLEIEHFIPVSRGGTHTKDNVIFVCKKCNSKKGNLTYDEFIYKLGYFRVP